MSRMEMEKGETVMSKELTLNINGKARKLFFQTGFYSHERYKNLNFHVHSYEEVHIFLGCTAEVICDGVSYTVGEGEVVMLPRGSYHAYKMSGEEGSLHQTFQIDLPIEGVKIKRLPRDLLYRMHEEAAKIKLENDGIDHSRVALYLAFVCGHFAERENCYPKTVRDYAFIIREYIAYHYSRNITLDTLAAELCVSKKQAERLVIRYTGKTFLEVLTETRMTVAEQYLAVDAGLPLTKVAALVGYQSYSGFYKAYKRYKEAKSGKNVKK